MEIDYNISSLYICVDDMERAINFYEELFEKAVTVRDEIYSVFDINGFRYGLFNYKKMEEKHTFGNNCLPSIEVSDLNKFIEKLKTLKSKIVFPITKIGSNYVLEFVDSEGNNIEATCPINQHNDIVFEKIHKDNRNTVNEFILKNWFSTTMAVRGRIVDMTKLDGIMASENNKIIGLITYEIVDDELEIMSLDSIYEKHGIGTKLINNVLNIAKGSNCTKIKLITTNDNINAIKFYQKRGFNISVIYKDAVAKARELKKEIPLIGDNDIPIRDEIEFILNL